MASAFFDTAAQEASESEEELDEETGEPKRPRKEGVDGVNGHLSDSSEESEDDEDAERAVREGFIVDEDEEGEEAQQRKRRRKRRREEDEDVNLEEEDLELIGELQPEKKQESKFKRLKTGRGRREEQRGVGDLFDDEDEEEEDRRPDGGAGEFDDFIEEDEPGQGRGPDDEDRDITRRPQGQGVAGLQYLDETEEEDMRAAFGDGTEYDWALQLQEQGEDKELYPDKELELKDVFEPSQLAERLLTEEDYMIRQTDIPERYQLARKAFTQYDWTEEEEAKRAAEEADWVSSMLWSRKTLDEIFKGPFRDLVADILKLINVENYEVPFICQHRKDYMIYTRKTPIEGAEDQPEALQYQIDAEKLLNNQDIWDILDHDLKWRALTEKRIALENTYKSLQTEFGVQSEVLDELMPKTESSEDIQDLQDFLAFQYSSELKDLNLKNSDQVNGERKQIKKEASLFERLRQAQGYRVVTEGFGITADTFAKSAESALSGPKSRRGYTEDPSDRPEDLADQHMDEYFQTGKDVLSAAKRMFVEELTTSPRFRKLLRGLHFTESHIDCVRTEEGMRKIDEQHPYYEFKYLRNQSFGSVVRKPENFLKMLAAEREGLLEVRVRLENKAGIIKRLVGVLESDNYSEVADAWNALRKAMLELAFTKLEKPIMRQVKENLRNECEKMLAKNCKEELSRRLDQAPYQPKGMTMGTEPRVLALTNGNGTVGRDPITWAWVEDGSRVLENGKFDDFKMGNAEKGIPDGKDVRTFVDLVQRRSPDVIAVSGFSPETRILYDNLKMICERNNLRSAEFTDEDEQPKRDPLEVWMVNDEVARLYHTSDRSSSEFPSLAPLTKYCVAIARYVQSPLQEYVSLGRDLTSISLDPSQHLVPQDKLVRYLDVAIIDIVNIVGVNINDAVNDARLASLLPYVCGLGPRKAQYLLQAITRNGGFVSSRTELLGDPEANKFQTVTAQIFANCASFLVIDYDDHEPTSDYLDSTRIHPEDYELARKVAADGLEMDEEDIKAEQDEHGESGVVRKLIREEKQETLFSLMLEMYAEQLERLFKQKKRATLETIRAELQSPFEELRPEFQAMSSSEMFTMMTGETRETLDEGMVIPVSIRKVFADRIEARLDCGVEASVNDSEYPSGVGLGGQDAKTVFHPQQTVQARLLSLDRRRLVAQLSLREEQIRKAQRKDVDRDPGEWDDAQEEQDRRETVKRKEDVSGRAQRVIKHPLFRPFNAHQAEEWLGSQSRGDCVIRPSSKGLDHLCISWKVADGVFQHIDVLELDKENEFSVGRVLKVGGKYSYSDLDELIELHVKSMSKKVDEITADERFQNGSKAQTAKWLNAYMEANPKRSMYAFCIDQDHAGYFALCFKQKPDSKQASWPIKVIPNAFQLHKNDYPTMMALKNGFKTMIQAQQRRY